MMSLCELFTHIAFVLLHLIESAFTIFHSHKSRSRETEVQLEENIYGRDGIRLCGLKAVAAAGLWKRCRTGFFPTSFYTVRRDKFHRELPAKSHGFR